MPNKQLYNLMFVLPLAVLGALVYWGISTKRLGNILVQHLGGIKLLLAAVFAGLGLLILLL